MFEGFVVGKDRVHIPILQFADDALLFCKYDEEMMENLKKTLLVFEWCSGQKINWEKSAICGLNIEDSKVISTANILNCKVESLPFIYLSLPLGGYPKSARLWQPILDKVHGKLDKWRRCNLCRGGRITLCKSVLSSLPTYYMSVFLMPESALKLFGKNHRKFFGEGNKGGMLNHLVKWDAVIKSYKDGGLSLGKLKHKNTALLSKWG